MKERAKECLLSHPLFHGGQALDLLDASQQPSCITTKTSLISRVLVRVCARECVLSYEALLGVSYSLEFF
jgi:hypothetical protein